MRTAVITRALQLSRAAPCAHRRVVARRRRFSASATEEIGEYVTLEDLGDGVGSLTLRRAPVNALDAELCRQLVEAHAAAVACKELRGLVLKSELPKVFSAGLDLEDLASGDRGVVEALWAGGVQEVFKSLYGSPLVLSAAIGGHAPAGGCFLALLCDIRIAAANARLGLTETRVGLTHPWYFAEVMRAAIGPRETERAMQLGTLFTAEEALKIGLVDQVASSKEDAEALAEQEVRRWLEVPDIARQKTKLTIRKTVLDEFRASRSDDFDMFCRQVESPHVQKALQEYLEKLRSRGD